MRKQIRIATRGSALAIKQAQLVGLAIENLKIDLKCIICPIITTGDKLLELDLSKVGGKGLFLKEIEQNLLQGECDIAVHSMKDVPVELPDNLVIPSMLKRADPRDVLLSNVGYTIKSLPPGARVGTCSSRRGHILNYMRPDVDVLPIRGNICTRWKKLINGEYDAIILALCGMQRIDMTSIPHEVIPVEIMVPAIGQGAIGIECRQDDKEMNQLLAQINHQDTYHAIEMERQFMRQMHADCTTPIGGYYERCGEHYRMLTYYSSARSTGIKVFTGGEKEVLMKALEYYKQSKTA
jgi:hydroxymethylbilane synthase